MSLPRTQILKKSSVLPSIFIFACCSGAIATVTPDDVACDSDGAAEDTVCLMQRKITFQQGQQNAKAIRDGGQRMVSQAFSANASSISPGSVNCVIDSNWPRSIFVSIGSFMGDVWRFLVSGFCKVVSPLHEFEFCAEVQTTTKSPFGDYMSDRNATSAETVECIISLPSGNWTWRSISDDWTWRGPKIISSNWTWGSIKEDVEDSSTSFFCGAEAVLSPLVEFNFCVNKTNAPLDTAGDDDYIHDKK